jgi:hypothetical protein
MHHSKKYISLHLLTPFSDKESSTHHGKRNKLNYRKDPSVIGQFPDLGRW